MHPREVPQEKSLFGMIRHTEALNGHGTVVAYKDNASVIEGHTAGRFFANPDGPIATRRNKRAWRDTISAIEEMKQDDRRTPPVAP